MKKKIFIKNFGCQMNVRDSEVIRGLLQESGYEFTAEPEKADIILFNTCSVRQHAEDKVWSGIGRYKAKGPSRSLRANQAKRKIIGLIGCMAQNYGRDAFHKAPEIDFIVGPSDIAKIPGIVSKFVHRPSSVVHHNLYETKIWETDGDTRPDEIYHTGFYEDKNHAFVVISEGCSNFCSYCVVPYVRGPLHNRNYKAILKEIEEAVDKGITEITLLGQNVNAYISSPGLKAQSSKLQCKTKDSEEINFVDLLKLVNEIKGLKEFSFITSHPKDTSIELFKAMRDAEKLKKYLHLPVQSGSDRILKLMNRGYTGRFYLDLVDNYRKIVRNGVLTTDIIVGFPSEGEEDFQATCDLVKKTEFDAAFIFKYSSRQHTEAQKFIDDVAKEEKERRHRLVLDLQKLISKRKKI